MIIAVCLHRYLYYSSLRVRAVTGIMEQGIASPRTAFGDSWKRTENRRNTKPRVYDVGWSQASIERLINTNIILAILVGDLLTQRCMFLMNSIRG